MHFIIMQNKQYYVSHQIMFNIGFFVDQLEAWPSQRFQFCTQIIKSYRDVQCSLFGKMMVLFQEFVQRPARWPAIRTFRVFTPRYKVTERAQQW